MPHLDTDLMDLDIPCEQKIRHRGIVDRYVIPAIVVFGLTGGAASISWFGSAQYTRNEMEVEHQAELDRMQRSHEMALHILGHQVGEAAERVTDAASAVTNAASSVGVATNEAKNAAQSANRAAKKADAARDVTIRPSVVNQEIRKADERIAQ